MDLTLFFEEQARLLEKTSLQFKRGIFTKIDQNERSIALLGQRGVGKTTLMLQMIKERHDPKKALYISVDNPYFTTVSLYEFAKHFEKYGGEALFIDEIHKYRDFASHLKAIYDSTNLQITVSGSSLLQIYKNQADLSRRVVVYNIANLSFREYLQIKGFDFDVYRIEDILQDHPTIAGNIASQIRPLKYFQEYLEYGAYPFILEGEKSYKSKLINILNHIIEVDLPYVSNITYTNIDKIKKLLYLLATSVPFTPNINELSQKSSISRPSVLEYLFLLEKAQIVINLHYKGRGYSKLQKPDKIYLNNTNLIRAITQEYKKGNERETFFVNQIRNLFSSQPHFFNESLLLSKEGDFLIEGKTFEIGGKNKTDKQIKRVDDAFLVKDDIEIGYKNEIPLWLFGFLY